LEIIQYQTVFDAFADWKELVVAELSKLKLNHDSTADVKYLYLQLLQYRRRTIDPRKREIIEAKHFKCPPHLISGYRILRKKIRQGKNLNSNLSTRVDNLSTRDAMLNDWGLYHFHLGTPSLSTATTYSGRTADLLFAAITADVFYAAGIWPHEFAKLEIFEAVRANWPHLFHHAKLNGVVDLAHKSYAEDVALLRKHGIISLQMVADDCYLPPGGGYASTGDNLIDVDYLQEVVRQLKHLENNVSQVTAHFLKTSAPGQLPNPLVLKLILVEADRAVLMEPNSGRQFTVLQNGRHQRRK
jgi:hypothetical protein